MFSTPLWFVINNLKMADIRTLKLLRFFNFIDVIKFCHFLYALGRVEAKRIEYILEWNLLEKSVKRPFCCIVSILQA